MGTWIELRCERRTQSVAEGYPYARCWSHDNEGPMGEAEDNRASLVATMQQLEKVARATGWVKTRVGWVCPHCAAKP